MPMTKYKLKLVGGVLKNIEDGYPYPESLRFEFRRAVRAAERGQGPKKRPASFSHQALVVIMGAKAETTEGLRPTSAHSCAWALGE